MEKYLHFKGRRRQRTFLGKRKMTSIERTIKYDLKTRQYLYDDRRDKILHIMAN